MVRCRRAAFAFVEHTRHTPTCGTAISDMMEELFWTVSKPPSIAQSRNSDRRAATVVCPAASSELSMHRFHRCSGCQLDMDWAKHRRRGQGGPKTLLRLNLPFLPVYRARIASHHDDTRALPLCAGLAGVIADSTRPTSTSPTLFNLNLLGDQSEGQPVLPRLSQAAAQARRQHHPR